MALVEDSSKQAGRPWSRSSDFMSYLQVMQTQGQRLGLVWTFEPSDVTPSDLLQTISKPPKTVSPTREPSIQIHESAEAILTVTTTGFFFFNEIAFEKQKMGGNRKFPRKRGFSI